MLETFNNKKVGGFRLRNLLAAIFLSALILFLVFSLSSIRIAEADVAFRSSNSTNYAANQTSTTITAPSGIVNGDLLIIFFDIGAASPPTPTPPAGFNIITGFPTTVTDSGFSVKTYAWYKIASGESGNYTVTNSPASTQGYMMAVSGANTTTPFNPNPTTNTGGGTISTATGLTTSLNNSLVIYLESDWGDNIGAMSPPTGSTPTFTERLDPGTVSGLMYVADGVMTTAGATGDKTQTNDNIGSRPWMAALIAVQPVSAPPPVTASAHVKVRGGGGGSITGFDTPTFRSSSSRNSTATSLSLTSPISITSGDTLIAVCYWANTSETVTVSDGNGTNTWIPIGSPQNGAGGLSSYRTQSFYVMNAKAGTYNISCNGSASNDKGIAVHVAYGIAASNALDQHDIANTSGTTVNSPAVTTTQDSEYLFGACLLGSVYNNIDLSPWVLRENANFATNGTEDQVVSAKGTYSAHFAQNPSGNATCLINTFKAAGGTVGSVAPIIKIRGGGGGLVAGSSDNFTGADTTPLATHDSNWVDMDTSIFTVAGLEIFNNQVRNAGASTIGAAMYSASNSDTSQMVAKAYSDTAANKAVCVRAGLSGATYKTGYCLTFITASGGNWTSLRFTKGGLTLGDTAAVSYSQAADHTLKITASGSSSVTINGYVDGNLAGSFTDSSSPFGAGGHPGFIISPNGGSFYMDDWTEGTTGGGGGGVKFR